jgi:arsenate reductase
MTRKSVVPLTRKTRVLFICQANAGRSQLAEGILRHLYGDHYQVESAGLDPRAINPLTLQVLEEMGVDTLPQEAKGLQKFEGQEFDLVVSLCGGEDEECPVFLTAGEFIHQGFPDPRSISLDNRLTLDEKLDEFRRVRDQIRNWIEVRFEPGKRLKTG